MNKQISSIQTPNLFSKTMNIIYAELQYYTFRPSTDKSQQQQLEEEEEEKAD